MNVLGISCHYHDAAACLVRDGVVVAAAQEERFNRVKASSDFPLQAINYCVQAGGISFRELDHVTFYEKPYLKFSRVLLDHVEAYPFSLPQLLNTMPHWLEDRLILPLVLRRELDYRGPVHFLPHHLSHAASTFLVSPFPEAAVLIADGVGEWATTTLGRGSQRKLEILKEIRYPHSLGLLYSAITAFLGFRANMHEGIVMGLAGYGKPRYLDTFREMVTVKPDGSYRMDPRYFGFSRGRQMWSQRLVRALGPPREPDAEVEERHQDVAASLQTFIEESLLLMARHLHALTRSDALCLAGGLFLNCVANHRILEETPFERVFVQPASGDAGGALGAAIYTDNVLLARPRHHVMKTAYLGPEFTDAQIRRTLSARRVPFREMPAEELLPAIARAIADGKVVGWFQGRMEFGPRALGNRSILADPCRPETKDSLNNRVKKREPFRPFAPVVLEDRASEYFELKGDSPFMLLAPRVRRSAENLLPAITHVDGTARVQTVTDDQNPRLCRLLREFEALRGVPVLVNTSLNLRGDPIACSPEDAVDSFVRSEMDVLVLGNCIVER